MNIAQKYAIEYLKVHTAQKYTIEYFKVHIAQTYAIEWITLAGIYKSMEHTGGDS